MLKY
ncbi:hypothetical protein BpHYR1_039279 [Brachionus plicatilis]|jgi:type IV secretory pathway VirB2 component (pilin)